MCWFSGRRYEKLFFQNVRCSASLAGPLPLGSAHLREAFQNYLQARRSQAFAYGGAILESENRKAAVQVLHCSCKGPFALSTFTCRLISERQAGQFLWRASRFCAMEEIYRSRSNSGFLTLLRTRSCALSLRSLTKAMKWLWKTPESRSLSSNSVIKNTFSFLCFCHVPRSLAQHTSLKQLSLLHYLYTQLFCFTSLMFYYYKANTLSKADPLNQSCLNVRSGIV